MFSAQSPEGRGAKQVSACRLAGISSFFTPKPKGMPFFILLFFKNQNMQQNHRIRSSPFLDKLIFSYLTANMQNAEFPSLPIFGGESCKK